MASSFKTGIVYRSTPFGVLVNFGDGQQRIVGNGLNKRISAGAEVLVGKNDLSEKVIARRYG